MLVARVHRPITSQAELETPGEAPSPARA
jgi:hypothetical protein